MGKKIKVWEDGIHVGTVPLLEDLWKQRGGYVVNNLLDDLDGGWSEIDYNEPMHFSIHDSIQDLARGLEALDEAEELGADTMEVSRLHNSKWHDYDHVDIYFY
jgi:hypothetical protein